MSTLCTDYCDHSAHRPDPPAVHVFKQRAGVSDGHTERAEHGIVRTRRTHTSAQSHAALAAAVGQSRRGSARVDRQTPCKVRSHAFMRVLCVRACVRECVRACECALARSVLA